MSDIKTCPGYCCMSFPLTPRLEELIESVVSTTKRFFRGEPTDDETVIDMLEIDPNSKDHYTCNRFDRKTMSCTRYDERPDLCRRYPYGKVCGWCHLNVEQLALPA